MARDLAHVLDAVLDGVLVVGRGGVVELLNAEACRILGTSAESAQGQALERLLGEHHAGVELTRAVLASGRPSLASEVRLRRRFQSDLVVDLAASPLFEEERSPSGVVLLLCDRTIQRSLHQLVNERERLDDLGRIAAGIAHEVKNPLGGIRGAAEILGARASDPKSRDAAELIVREVDRIAALVNELMVFTRGGDLAPEPVNIHRVLDEVIELLALDPSAERVDVEREFDPSIPELLADAGRLTQVFLNLAQNAVQAMGEHGGRLVIRTRVSLDHRLEAGIPTLLVELTDTGPGIPADVLEQLATPFFTTRAGGTGLGLAVSRQWVTRHGGTLRVESRVGEGTTARVALPLREPS